MGAAKASKRTHPGLIKNIAHSVKRFLKDEDATREIALMATEDIAEVIYSMKGDEALHVLSRFGYVNVVRAEAVRVSLERGMTSDSSWGSFAIPVLSELLKRSYPRRVVYDHIASVNSSGDGKKVKTNKNEYVPDYSASYRERLPFVHFFILFLMCWTFYKRVSINRMTAWLSTLLLAISTVFTFGASFLLVLPITLICFVLVPQVLSSEDHRYEWINFQNSMFYDRVSYPLELAIPPDLAHLYAVDSWVDVEDYPIKKGVRYFVSFENYYISSSTPDILGLDIILPIFSDCIPLLFMNSHHNQEVAIRTRVICDVAPVPQKGFWNHVDELFRKYIPIEKFGDQVHIMDGYVPDSYLEENDREVTFEFYADRFPPTKRNKLYRTHEKMKGTGHYDYVPKRNVYKAFVKCEAQLLINFLPYTPTRPRCIQGCSEQLKYITGPWFLKYSTCLKNVWNYRACIYYSNGRTADDLNQWFNFWYNLFGGRVIFFSSDFSKYDMTQTEKCISSENNWYKELGIEDLLNGKDVLKAKEYTRAFAACAAYFYEWLRKSGDNDTSAGNSVNTAKAIVSFLEDNGIKLCPLNEEPSLKNSEAATSVIGDDNFTILLIVALVRAFVTAANMLAMFKIHCNKMGFVATGEVSINVLDAEYQSLRFYPSRTGFHVGKKAGKNLPKIGVFRHNKDKNRRELLETAHSTLISYLPTSSHVPFLRRYIFVLLDWMNENKIGRDTQHKYKLEHHKYLKGTTHTADDETFASFYETYGLNADDEDDFAKYLKVSVDRYGPTCILSSHTVGILAGIDN
jgi:hypothetical protein